MENRKQMAGKNAIAQETQTPPGAPGGMPEGMPRADAVDPMSQQISIMMNGGGGAQGGSNLGLGGLDLSKVRDGSFSLLTDGEDYEFWIARVVPKISAKGNKGFMMVLEVTEDYEDAGATIADNITITEAAMWRLKALASACDLLSDVGTLMVSSEQDFVGYKIAGTIKNEPWDGVLRSKINGAPKAPDGGPRQRRSADGTSGLPPATLGTLPEGFSA